MAKNSLHAAVALGLIAVTTATSGSAAPNAAPTKKAADKTSSAHRGATARASTPASEIIGRSVGSPTDGQLVGGARLADGPHLRSYPVYAGHEARWGLPSLVSMIDRSAKAVRKQYPDAVLSVGHLSKAGGGEIDRHASHESGRDADLGFYVKSKSGKPLYADHMVPFAPDGSAPSWPGAYFDEAKNWALVASLLADGRARITHIFVATHIRERLLTYAQRNGVPYAVRVRASEVLAQPRGALPHDDHFHVRIACPSSSDKCIELPVARALKPHGTTTAHARGTAKPARPAPPAPSTRTPTPNASPPVTEPASREATAQNESEIPNLTPAIPGLDAVVIAAPLAGLKQEPPAVKEEKKTDPVDDPDGVLDGR